jgi:hypothetical protein
MSPRIAPPRAIIGNCDSFAECSALPQAVLGPSLSTPEALGFPHFMTTERSLQSGRTVGKIIQYYQFGAESKGVSSRPYQSGFPELPPLMDRWLAAAT